jgi:regulator of replication initiation timing
MVNVWLIVITTALVSILAVLLVLSGKKDFGGETPNLRIMVDDRINQIESKEKEDISKLSKTFNEQFQKIDNVDKVYKTHETKIAEIEQRTKSQQEEVAKLRKENEHLGSKMNDIDQTVKELLRKSTSGTIAETKPSKDGTPIDAKTIDTSTIEDFTSCSAFTSKKVNSDFPPTTTPRIYEMVRLGISSFCVGGTSDVSVYFSWEGTDVCSNEAKSHVSVRYWQVEGAASAEKTETDAQMVGCFVDDKSRTWRFFAARLSRLKPEINYSYTLEYDKYATPRVFSAPPLPGSKTETNIILVGDTQMPNANRVIQSFAKFTGFHDLVVHVGDGTYTTNHGDCYNKKGDRDANGHCGWNCTGLTCAAANRMSAGVLDGVRGWTRQFDGSINGRMPWMTTMGNHDNDLQWFLSVRPTAASALPGVHPSDVFYDTKESILQFAHSGKTMQELMMLAAEYMKMPHFYSFDYGQIHIVSIGTEDNPMNAYEEFNGQPLTDELNLRFEKHFGRNSRQFQWLVKDLAQANARRDKVPWILLYTHRPLYHTSSHHPNCGRGGDWYVCMVRDTYEPVLRQFGVDIVMSGHSHHYSRSFPMFKGAVDMEKGTIHSVIGTGGFELTNRFSTAPWVASRRGDRFGYVHLSITNSTHAKWVFVDADTTVLDELWIVRQRS